jgi:VIT1/CCC1 family predicted Fe2+/Mn2+ transporter
MAKFNDIIGVVSPINWSGVQIALLSMAREVVGTTPEDAVKIVENTTGNLWFRELDQRGRILRAQKKTFIQRIIMAMFGGVALVGPMLIMTLHQSRNTSLITVSAATFVFAIILALCATDSSGKDVLAATAAYAAVLVVFVGTSNGSSG